MLKDAVYKTPKFMGTVRLLPDHRVQFIPTNKITDVTNPVPYDGSDYTRSGIADAVRHPSSLALGQNYPNPFNPSTTVDYMLTKSGRVRLAVFDLRGREVAVLADGVASAGSHSASFDALHLDSGVYFYRLESEGKMLTRKMLVMK